MSVGEAEKASTGWRKVMAGLAQQQVESTEDDNDLGGLVNCQVYIKKQKSQSYFTYLILGYCMR